MRRHGACRLRGPLPDLLEGELAEAGAEKIVARLADLLRLVRATVIYSAWVRGSIIYPQFTGKLDKTPSESLNLQPGELVQVRSLEEILATLDKQNKNRGILFDRLVPYCGGIYKVLGRINKIIHEKTGK